MSAYTFDVNREGSTRTLLVSELRVDDFSFAEAKGEYSAELDVLLSVTHFATGRSFGDRPVRMKLERAVRRRGARTRGTA